MGGLVGTGGDEWVGWYRWLAVDWLAQVIMGGLVGTGGHGWVGWHRWLQVDWHG